MSLRQRDPGRTKSRENSSLFIFSLQQQSGAGAGAGAGTSGSGGGGGGTAQEYSLFKDLSAGGNMWGATGEPHNVEPPSPQVTARVPYVRTLLYFIYINIKFMP